LNLQDHILHIGPAFGLEKKRLLSIADIFIFPTFYDKECFPLVILEAMTLKIPTISTNEGAIEEIIDHNKSGFIVEKRDVPSIASKITTLMENPKLRYSMAKNAYEKYKGNYTLDIFENNYKSLIKNIINDERIVVDSGNRKY
jgi:glycosyltransferase involved in cell wall biosynthesis